MGQFLSQRHKVKLALEVNAKTKFQVVWIWIDGFNGKMRWLDIEGEPNTKIDWNYVKSSLHLCS